jgi:ribosomal protein S20
MKKEFYVYAYLNPNKPGQYTYRSICFLYEPFYIGKGINERYKSHLQSAKKQLNFSIRNHKINKIKKILRSGKQPIITILRHGLTDNKSCKVEISLIRQIGRADMNKGPLVNRTDGGQGLLATVERNGSNNPFYGKKLTKRHRQRIIESNKTRIVSEETKAKIRASVKGFRHSLETRKKMSLNRRGENNNFFGKTHSLKTRLLISSRVKLNKGKKIKQKRMTITRRLMDVKLIRRKLKIIAV